MKKGQLINMIVMALLALVIAVWSFMNVEDEEQVQAEYWELSTGVSFDEQLSATDVMYARRNGRDVVVAMPGAEFSMSWDEAAGHLDLDLEKGEVIFSTIADDFSVSVNSDFARVDSQSSAAYVALDTEKNELSAYAITHPSLISFILEGEDLNAISLPTDYRVSIPKSKISETIGKLRLTKLSKEFQTFEIEEGDIPGDIYSQLAVVRTAYTENSVDFLTELQGGSDFGPPESGLAAIVYNSYGAVRELLTFMPHANSRLEERQLSDSLLYAMSNLYFGEQAIGDTWLSGWKSYDHTVSDVRNLYSSLFFVLPGDELYPVKAATSDIVYEGKGTINSLRKQYQEIESLLSRASQVEAVVAYKQYVKEFKDALDSGKFDDEQWLDDISREYVLLELMLRSHSLFYNVDSIALLAELEGKILDLAGSDQDLNEERQAFVQSKIRFLDNLFDFVVDRKVSVDDATDLANELLFSAETYLSEISAEVAVSNFFRTSLEEFDLSIRFINSPEFYAYSDFDEGLKAFKTKEKDLNDLNEYLQNLRSGELSGVASISLEKATDEVQIALTQNGVQYAEVVALGDAEYRLFEIVGARTGGFQFEANYDRETHILYDVVLGDVRFSTGLALENAREVIIEAMKEVTADEVDEEVLSEESSLTETVALQSAITKFVDAGLDEKDFSLEILDLDKNTFSFEGVISPAELPVSGEFDLDTDMVSNITWDLNGTEQRLPNLALSQLETAIYATYQALVGTK